MISELATYLCNRYLSLQDTHFIELVEEDLQDFLKKVTKTRVLVFPPVDSYHRLLIHQTVQANKSLHSFSVGEGDERRTVVCLQETLTRGPKGRELMSSPFSSCQKGKGRGRGRYSEKSSPSPSGDNAHRSPRRNDDEGIRTSDSAESRKSRASTGRGRAKRPEIQLYVPRGRRSQTDSASQVTDSTNNGLPIQDRLELRDEELTTVTSQPANVQSKNSRRKEKEMVVYVPKGRRLKENDVNIKDESLGKSQCSKQASIPDPVQLPNPVLKKIKIKPSGDYSPCIENTSFQDIEDKISVLSDILPQASNSTSPDKNELKGSETENSGSSKSFAISKEMVVMPPHHEASLVLSQPLNMSSCDLVQAEEEDTCCHPQNIAESPGLVASSNLVQTHNMKEACSDVKDAGTLGNTDHNTNSSDFRGERTHSESSVNKILENGCKEDSDMYLVQTDDNVSDEITSSVDKKDVLGPELTSDADGFQDGPNATISTEDVSKCSDINVDAINNTLDNSDKESKKTIEKPEQLNGGEKMEEDESDDEESWDKLFDDNGDCLEPSLMEELTAHVGAVQIEKPSKINYLAYQPKDPDLSSSAFSHLIEIYDFPADFTTRDLLATFQSYMSKGFDIKWVDDTHAIGVFSSAIAAQDALKMIHPLLKLRPIEMASKQAKLKAKRTTEFLLPYKERPKTTAMAARRLVSGALGLSSKVSKEKSEQEKIQLKEAKEKRRNERKLKQDIWDGSFGKCAMDES